MKVIEVLETDEFDRQEVLPDDKLVYLYRNQARHSSSLQTYLYHIAEKYIVPQYGPEVLKDLDPSTGDLVHLLSAKQTQEWIRPYQQLLSNEMTPYEYIKLSDGFMKTLRAKRTYEEAGGRYEGWKA